MNKDKLYFYHDKRSLNEATSTYIQTIFKNFKEKYEIIYINSFSNISVNKKDIIFTITSLYYCKAKLRHPFNVHFFWAQGVSPEEFYLLTGKKNFKFFLKTLMEKVSIKTANFNFLVSKTMLDHYKKKYNYTKDNYLIMPCFNIHDLSFDNQLVKNDHSFVYAGNLAKWQCIEEMLSIFEAYQSHVPEATICFYTRDRIELEKIIDKYKIKNYTINFVAVDKLQQELLKYKFGFIIREDNIVNNVSTPTKMNSYLASYVVPIITDVIGDFNIHFNKSKNVLILPSKINVKDKAKLILNFDTNNDYSYADFKGIFDTYYNITKYEEMIQEKLKLY